MKGLVSKEIIVLRCRGVKQENVARKICELSFGALARPFLNLFDNKIFLFLIIPWYCCRRVVSSIILPSSKYMGP